MGKVTTQIEIASSPEHVRRVFLDFAKLPEWTQSHFTSIVPVAAQKSSVEEGDKLSVTLAGMTIVTVVMENSLGLFTWRGSIPLLFQGDHSFAFQPSQTTPGSTTFVHSEHSHGILAPVMPFLSKEFTEETARAKFGAFNEDLKRRVESLV